MTTSLARKLPGLLALLLLAVAQTEAAPQLETVVFSTGEPGGGYWRAGARLQGVAADMGFAVENLASAGSTENIERLLDPQSPVGLAFAQADVLQHYFNAHPDAEQKLDVLESIGRECVFLVTASASGMRTDEDLQDRAARITLGIDSEASGVAATFDYLRSLAPELDEITIAFGDTRAALERLMQSADGVDAVMVVHRPRVHSPEVDIVIASPGHFNLVHFSDERFTRPLAGGRKIYRRMRLGLPGLEKPVVTICTRGLLIAHKEKLSVRQSNKLTDLVNYHWMRVFVSP
tara:strand:- start:31830 stop:32702 length:873 start_codon:yes stop_codon:yes gene_type:complete